MKKEREIAQTDYNKPAPNIQLSSIIIFPLLSIRLWQSRRNSKLENIYVFISLVWCLLWIAYEITWKDKRVQFTRERNGKTCFETAKIKIRWQFECALQLIHWKWVFLHWNRPHSVVMSHTMLDASDSYYNVLLFKCSLFSCMSNVIYLNCQCKMALRERLLDSKNTDKFIKMNFQPLVSDANTAKQFYLQNCPWKSMDTSFWGHILSHTHWRRVMALLG